jgi:hypothetical protein
MGIVQDLFDELRSYIRVTVSYSGFQQSNINVGERFQLQVTISNLAPITHPAIAFKIEPCFVYATEFATPIHDDGKEMSYNQAFFDWPYAQHVLKAGGLSEITSRPVRMIAKGLGPETSPEDVARINFGFEWIPTQRYLLENVFQRDIEPGYS